MKFYLAGAASKFIRLIFLDLILINSMVELSVHLITYNNEKHRFRAVWRGAPHYNSSGPLSFTYMTTENK